jgi:hypothetical protein
MNISTHISPIRSTLRFGYVLGNPEGFKYAFIIQKIASDSLKRKELFIKTRLCKAVLDRLTDEAHIIEAGAESYRFRRTLSRKLKG